MKRLKISSGFLFVLGSVILSAVAQLAMKAGTLEVDKLSWVVDDSIWAVLNWVMIGVGSYAVSMLLWMFALARYELSFAYPMLSMSYVLVYIGAALWPRLNESVSLWKTEGILFVIIGVVLVTMQQKK